MGYAQREDKVTIGKAAQEQRGAGCGAAWPDRHCGAGDSQLREINAALPDLLELSEILLICIEN